MPWKPAISERQLLDELERLLQQNVPANWSVELTRSPRASLKSRPDALLTLRAPDGATAQLVVEVKVNLDPRAAIEAGRSLKMLNPEASPLLLAPYVSPNTAQRLAAEDISYVDTRGNARVATDQPAFFLKLIGDQRSPAPDNRPIRSLKGPTAGRVVRALVDFLPPYTLSHLVQIALVPVASAYRVVDFLFREALLEREPRGPIVSVDWEGVIRRWANDYSYAGSNRTRTYLDPRGIDSVRRSLSEYEAKYSITGSLGVRPYTTGAPVRLATVFVEDADAAAEVLGLREAETGANAILAEPFDPVVFERGRYMEGLNYAAPSQVAVDLLTGPGRGPSEFDQLLRWMKRNENAWRTRP
jgi:hypothetical protein